MTFDITEVSSIYSWSDPADTKLLGYILLDMKLDGAYDSRFLKLWNGKVPGLQVTAKKV